MRSKRLIALMLTIVMALAMTATAFATESITETMDEDGEIGNFAPDGNPEAKLKSVVIYKHLVAYNPDGFTIKAPTVSYSYAIAPATFDSLYVTDEQNPAVTANVIAGAGEPAITSSVEWENSDSLSTGANGVVNDLPITIDFSNVVFPSAGVFRYKISETVSNIAASGITAGTSARERYLDVYVRASSTCDDGNDADDWEIYGYTCFVKNNSITASTKADVAKTIGFGSYTIGETKYTADSYYTFNLEIGKTVVNDSYAENNVEFPFTVIFTNDAVTGSIDIASSISGTVNGFRDPAAGALSSTKGIAKIKHNASVTYIGIPCGTSVEVYETNTATGVTYEVTTTLSPSTVTATPEMVSSTSTVPTTAVAQASQKPVYQSTKTVINTTADVAADSSFTISVTNKYSTISPTGVIVRYAPYALVLICGILLLLLGWKFLRRKETA